MKKIKIFITILAFSLAFPIHFLYTYCPNTIVGVVAPINESVWEHMKIIYTAIIISSVVELIIYKIKNIKVNNFMISIPVISIIGISIYLTIYMIISLFIPHNLYISIGLLFLVFILCEILSYKILNSNKIDYGKLIGLILLIISYAIFVYFTYNPLKTPLFLDTTNNTYGIKKLTK